MTDFLEGLSDEEMKKESKTEAKNDALSAIMKNLKSLGIYFIIFSLSPEHST